MSDKAKEAAAARGKLHMSIRRGIDVKASVCALCGSPDNLQACHEDYSKPYDVIWLCRRCRVRKTTIDRRAELKAIAARARLSVDHASSSSASANIASKHAPH